MAAAAAAGSLGRSRRCRGRHLLGDTAPEEASWGVRTNRCARTRPRLPHDTQRQTQAQAQRAVGVERAPTRGPCAPPTGEAQAAGTRSLRHGTLRLLQKAAKTGSTHLMAQVLALREGWQPGRRPERGASGLRAAAPELTASAQVCGRRPVPVPLCSAPVCLSTCGERAGTARAKQLGAQSAPRRPVTGALEGVRVCPRGACVSRNRGLRAAAGGHLRSPGSLSAHATPRSSPGHLVRKRNTEVNCANKPEPARPGT